MSMMYTGVFGAVAVTAAQDFFELTAPADCIVVVHMVEITQHSDFQDAGEEIVQIALKRGVGSTSGSGGTAPTPVKLQSGFAAAGSSLEVNNTTKMTSGTITTVWQSAWNERSPWLWLPTPEMRIVLSPSERLTVELVGAPGDSITTNGTIVFEEIGG